MALRATNLRERPLTQVPPSIVSLLSHEDFAIVPRTHEPCFQYCSRTDEWYQLFESVLPNRQKYKNAVFDEENGEILFCCHNQLWGCNIETKEFRMKWKRTKSIWEIKGVVVVGEHLHIISQETEPGLIRLDILDKSSGEEIQNTLILCRNSLFIEDAMLLKSKNSFIVLAANTDGYDLTIIQYWWSTNQFIRWKWVDSLTITVPIFVDFVLTQDERYLLMMHRRDGQITAICDLQRKSVSFVAINLSLRESWCHACTLRDEQSEELLMFGFVRETFKSPNFADVQLLPLYIIEMMGKWCCNEYLHVLHGKTDHLKYNMDDILARKGKMEKAEESDELDSDESSGSESDSGSSSGESKITGSESNRKVD